VTIRTCDRFWHQQRFPTLRCTALVPHLLWRGLAGRRADLAKKRFIVGQVFTFWGLVIMLRNCCATGPRMRFWQSRSSALNKANATLPTGVQHLGNRHQTSSPCRPPNHAKRPSFAQRF